MRKVQLMTVSVLSALVLGAVPSQWAAAHPAAGPSDPRAMVMVQQNQPEEGIKKSFTLTFPFGVGTLQECFGANASELNALRRLVRDNKDDLLFLTAYASLEGTRDYNIRLSEKRATSVKAFLVEAGFPAEQIIIRSAGEDWNGLADYVSGHAFSGQADVMRVLQDDSLSQEQKKNALKDLSHGQIWQYLLDNAMPGLRVVELAVVGQDSAYVPCEKSAPVVVEKQEPLQEAASAKEAVGAQIAEAEPEPEPEPEQEAKPATQLRQATQEKPAKGSVSVHGVVLDNQGNPLPGCSVYVLGTSNGTITDLDGHFSITVPASTKTLRVSCIGYEDKDVPVENGDLRVIMEDSTTYLDATIVIGYGSAQKIGNIVGSVTAVTSDELVNKPSANIADALQGKVAGLQIFNTSGEPQSSVSLRLRGESSLNLSTAPLYILDGIPVSSGVFNSINPQDIESISVLKDASSTAIYGSRAANGVIFISTKKGRLGEKPAISFRVQTGISMLTNYNMEMMNSKQLLQFEEMCKPELADDPAFQAKKAFILGNNINFDWTDYHFTKTAPIFQADGSVRGATDKTNYYLSYGYYSEKGTARANSGTQRFNVRANVSTDITSWLQVGTNLALSYARYHTVTTGWYSQSPILIAVTGIPYQTPYEIKYNEDGTISYGDVQWVYPWNGDMDLNEYYKYNTNDRQSADLLGQAYVLLQPIKGLKIRSQEAIDAYDYWSERVSKPSFTPYTYAGFNSQGVERYYQISSTNTIEYNTDFNRKHFLTVLLGQESILKHDKTLSARGEGLTDDRLVTLSAATTFSPSDQGGSDTEATFNSFFLNGNYNYDDRYFVDASVRHDGSSLFGANHKYATFYAVGGMWKISNEKFMRDVRWVDDLKMNVTYGTTGNSGMSSWYASLGLVGTGPIYNRVSGWGLSQVPNADLTWETVATLNLRLAGRVFDRVDFDLQWYNKASSNLIMDLPFSATTGHSSGTGNVAALVNRGVDLALTVDILHTRDLYWGISANMNYNMNKITKLYQGLDELAMPDYALKYQVGYSSSLVYVQQRAGVDPEDGCPMWYLEDGTTTKEYNEAPMMFWEGHDSTSPWSGGFSTNLSWRNWGLNADFSWIGDRWIFMNERYYTLNPTDQLGNSNFEVKMLDMWTTPGQVTDIPKYGTTFHHDTSRYSNAAFLRMKNISLSYSLPKSLLEKTRVVSAAKVYVTGRNLLTVTGFEGYDPEVGASNATSGMYPNSRQIVFGAEITF